jgi:plastocyanin
MRVTLGAGIIAFALVAGGVAYAQGSPAPSPPAAAALVHISGMTFRPSTVTVGAGEAVEFINDDDDAHTVTAEDKSFDSGYLAKGDTWTHVFASAGHFTYVCVYHDGMHGVVIVTAH